MVSHPFYYWRINLRAGFFRWITSAKNLLVSVICAHFWTIMRTFSSFKMEHVIIILRCQEHEKPPNIVAISLLFTSFRTLTMQLHHFHVASFNVGTPHEHTISNSFLRLINWCFQFRVLAFWKRVLIFVRIYSTFSAVRKNRQTWWITENSSPILAMRSVCEI